MVKTWDSVFLLFLKYSVVTSIKVYIWLGCFLKNNGLKFRG